MSTIMMIMMLVSICFMLYPQHVYDKLGISRRNQIKVLIGIFALYGVFNVVAIIGGIAAGIFPMFPIVMLIVDILIIKHYTEFI